MSGQEEKFSRKLVFLIFGVLIAAFVIYHTFGAMFSPYETEETVETTVRKTISADCYIVRKENVLKSNYDGFKVCKVSNGRRVAKNSSVIGFYKSDKDVELANEINNLESYLTSIESIDKQNTIKSADLDMISEQIKSNVYSYLKNINLGDFSLVRKDLTELQYFMAQRQLATGREDNYTDVINECRTKLNSLKSKYTSSENTVSSDYSGYFVNFTDGYENKFDYENIEDISVPDIQNLTADKIDKNQVGKVISENEWYIVTVVDSASFKGFSKGDTLKIVTSLPSVNELDVEIKAINKDDSSGKSALVLSCMKMNEELATLRKQNMQIVLQSYKGLKVNSKAVRVKNNEKGVYVKLGNVIRFVKVDIIYYSKDYVIVKSNYGENKLKIYDDIIVKGKNLNG